MMSQNCEINHIVSNFSQIYHTQVFRSNEYRKIEPLFVNFNRIEIILIIFNKIYDVIIANVHSQKENNEFIFLLMRQAIFHLFFICNRNYHGKTNPSVGWNFKSRIWRSLINFCETQIDWNHSNDCSLEMLTISTNKVEINFFDIFFWIPIDKDMRASESDPVFIFSFNAFWLYLFTNWLVVGLYLLWLLHVWIPWFGSRRIWFKFAIHKMCTCFIKVA